MYKGNIHNFIQRVNLYIEDKYNCKLILVRIKSEYAIGFFGPEDESVEAYCVYDREDFEEQIYDYINKNLIDVQGEYG